MGKRIAMVVGDLGSAYEMILAAPELEKRGAKLEWFADIEGKGRNALQNAAISYIGLTFEDVSYWQARHTKMDAYLVGTSATVNKLKISATQFGITVGIPVFWLEDLWGTGEHMNSRSVSPNVMLVNDNLAGEIALSVRPDIKVVAVGKPTFEKYLSMRERADEIRTNIRKQLGVPDGLALITMSFGGDPLERSEAQVPEVLSALKSFGDSVVVAWRFHPKHTRKFNLWNSAMRGGMLSVDASSTDLNELSIASTVVVADWGNTNGYVSVLCGTPTLTFLFPSQDKRLEGLGFPNNLPPVVARFPEWGVHSVADLSKALGSCVREEEQARSFTIKNRSPQWEEACAPGAASRIAEAILTRI
jgi:hypothetical protein